MTRAFDKSRPYSTFHPSHRGAVYWQDGGNFSADGKLLWEDNPAAAPAAVEKPEPAKKGDTDGDGELSALEARALLVKWLLGETDDAWFTVRSWGRAAFGQTLNTKDALITHCVDQGLVNAEDVRA